MKYLIKEINTIDQLEKYINEGWKLFDKFTYVNKAEPQPHYLDQPKEFWMPKFSDSITVVYLIKKKVTNKKYKEIKEKDKKDFQDLVTKYRQMAKSL